MHLTWRRRQNPPGTDTREDRQFIDTDTRTPSAISGSNKIHLVATATRAGRHILFLNTPFMPGALVIAA